MTDASTPRTRRALVLGGGGVAGIAWHLGMLAELLERGVDVDAADLVVGTSAGSVAGTILRFGQVQAVYGAQIDPAAPGLFDQQTEAEGQGGVDGRQPADARATDAAGRPGADAATAPVFDMAALGEQLATILQGAEDAQDARARLGRAAVALSAGSPDSPLLAELAAQFPEEHGWPQAPSACASSRPRPATFASSTAPAAWNSRAPWRPAAPCRWCSRR
ncbi:patatin-like phospholipase family protein [Frondihabitans sucicola]|uniref:patatin-like phospholipase family protein n=1 Tax=Frondihabitans sucicola TaxID=1268041 RepID=UPI0025737391|nr:patatin-like phospholipase family protein [Frondihabitans sucicola]